LTCCDAMLSRCSCPEQLMQMQTLQKSQVCKQRRHCEMRKAAKS